jgi:hypothetical protein
VRRIRPSAGCGLSHRPADGEISVKCRAKAGGAGKFASDFPALNSADDAMLQPVGALVRKFLLASAAIAGLAGSTFAVNAFAAPRRSTNRAKRGRDATVAGTLGRHARRTSCRHEGGA